MDKGKIIKLAIKELNFKLKLLETHILKTEKQRQESPSAMQSWSDTTRFQTGKIVEDLEREKERIVRHIDFLEFLEPNKKTKVELGSLVEILKGDKPEFYFVSLFPDLEIKIKNSNIRFVSVDAPLAKQILNKKPGDFVEGIKILSTV